MQDERKIAFLISKQNARQIFKASRTFAPLKAFLKPI